jgi:hypothetical protein
MTTTLEDQTTKDPTRIAWKTTIPDNNESDNKGSFDVNRSGNNQASNNSRSSNN